MLSLLLLTLAISVLINLFLFIPAYFLQTDKLTDASYSLSFIALTVVSLGTGLNQGGRWLLAVMVLLWACRLGAFLVVRIRHTGRDSRFDGVREHLWKFGRFWLGQAFAVWIILLPVTLALRAHNVGFITAVMPILGIVLFLSALAIESVADLQKYRFNIDPKNKGRWIDTGLWRYSRHPNYFGEMLVWIGVYLTALPWLSWPEWLVAAAGPVFIILLLRFVSGIPPLEKSAQERWGSDAAYQEYENRTNLLVLGPNRN